jgi:hypothetical protein
MQSATRSHAFSPQNRPMLPEEKGTLSAQNPKKTGNNPQMPK